MRLISAEALKAKVREKHKALPDRCEINELINDAPTIDAIPVEWLEEKMRGYADKMNAMEVAALVAVMRMWQEEQGAKA